MEHLRNLTAMLSAAGAATTNSGPATLKHDQAANPSIMSHLPLVPLAVTLGGLLFAWCLRNYLVRNDLARQTEQRYGSKYSLTDAEAARTGRPRMIHAGLQGVRDAQRIVRVPINFDVPFMAFTSLEFALFKTYAIPTISSLLLATGQLSKTENATRRFADTGLLISAMTTYPVPPLDLGGEDRMQPGDELISAQWEADPRASIAAARINYLHGRWKSKISNDDLLYTLSLFVLEPPAFVARYEWRRMTPLEIEALFTVWYHMGRCMRIEHIPETIEGLREWAEAYEAEHMVYDKANGAVARYTVDILLYSVPRFLHGAGYQVVYSLLDERLRKAFGFARAPRWLVRSMTPLLRLRSFAAMLLLPKNTGAPRTFTPSDVQDKIIRGEASGFCPATGISAGEAARQGKMCPVGQHSASPREAAAGVGEYDDLLSLTRMEPGWIENEPLYTRPAAARSLRWAYQMLFVRPDSRFGSTKWQNKQIRTAAAGAVDGKAQSKSKSNGKGKGTSKSPAFGFRLEECVSGTATRPIGVTIDLWLNPLEHTFSQGPDGLEITGREQVLAEAIKLNGGKPLTGPWAFKPKVQPLH